MPLCVHYWVIEPPARPTSKGECQHCHEVREFKNHVEAEFNRQEKPKKRERSE